MDALTRVTVYFPTATLASFWVLTNLVISDSGNCQSQEKQLLVAILIIFVILCMASCFTDTYLASDGQKFWVLMMPCYGPVCFSLPSPYDKDRVYDYFYLKNRDYVHALVCVTTFICMVITLNPVSCCFFPNDMFPGTSTFDPVVIRTVPVLIATMAALVMMCLGPPRQCIGYQNKPETCPFTKEPQADNAYARGPPPPEFEGGSYQGSEGREGSEIEMARNGPPPSTGREGPDGGPLRTSQTSRYSQRSPSGYDARASYQGPRDSYNDRGGYDDRR